MGERTVEADLFIDALDPSTKCLPQHDQCLVSLPDGPQSPEAAIGVMKTSVRGTKRREVGREVGEIKIHMNISQWYMYTKFVVFFENPPRETEKIRMFIVG